jgi:hypothetical protein
MSTCGKCGAPLSPDVEWCVRCYQPVLHPSAADADRPEFPDDVRYVTAPPSERVIVIPEADTEDTTDRSNPTRFGLAGKLLITAVVIAIGLGVRAVAFAWTENLGPMALAFTVVFLGVWAITAALVLWSTWQPERPRIVRVEGEVLSVTPARPRTEGTRSPTP